MVTCGLCGTDFAEDRSQAACRACPLGSDCGLVRCPECGYENPRDPAWLETIRGWLGGRRSGDGELPAAEADALPVGHGGAP